MEFTFEDHKYHKLLDKIGIRREGSKFQIIKVLIPMVVCWFPLAAITIINGNFWTGDISDSFISDFDTQVRFLISLPVLILSEKLISTKLSLILRQFKDSGIIMKDDFGAFDDLVTRSVKLLKSRWTFIALFLFCYLQVFTVLFYESANTVMLSWEIVNIDGEETLSLAGKWSTLISRPIILFFFLKWLVRIFVWGWLLRKISMLKLTIYAVHPDLCGGLGFLGYAVRYFSPIAFAISAAIAGFMIDNILVEGIHLESLKLPALGYLLFITILFTLPLILFTGKLIDAREQGVFEVNDFANGLYRELRTKLSKGFDKVSSEDLDSPAYSGAADLSALIDNALNMKFIPFTIKDLIPLWVMAALPFLAVIVVEIPITELFKTVMSFLV